MLCVAALLASSSMAAIELITLYARMYNAVNKMPLPPASHPSTLKKTSLEELPGFISCGGDAAEERSR